MAGEVAVRSGPEVGLERLQSRHHQIARLLFLGWKGRSIARYLGCSESHVSIVKNSPAVQRKLRLMNSAADRQAISIQQRISNLQGECLDVIVNDVVRNEDADLALRAKYAGDLLSRGGNSPIKRVETKSENVHLTIDMIEDLKRRAASSKESNNPEFA
jgi:hypothetical protein